MTGIDRRWRGARARCGNWGWERGKGAGKGGPWVSDVWLSTAHHAPQAVRPPPTHRLFDFSFQERGEGKGAGRTRTRSVDPVRVFRFYLEYLTPWVYPTVGAAPGL